MIHEKLAVPLSPPTSPRMSDTSAKIDYYDPKSFHDATLPQSSLEDTRSVGKPRTPQATDFNQSSRPMLRSYKSFPYSLGPSNGFQSDVSQVQTESGGFDDFGGRVFAQGSQPMPASSLPQPTYGGSAPTSPMGHLTPSSPKMEPRGVQMEDDLIDSDVGEQEEEAERPPKTAAELRAQKRKMKRFRLTHNQTRFLMSEFARQAHPDAAHRERLSREIPGLSPRQVQVWFQNRRAKLKRLTTDDRERMMRSRALPAGFDMTQALHSPFVAPTPSAGTSSVSSGTFAPFGNTSGVQPLTLDTMRRSQDLKPYTQQYPSGVTPALGNFAFTPPQLATETLSPGSAASSFSLQQAQESPRRNPFAVPLTGQPGYGSNVPQIPRLHNHDRFVRQASEVASSPLRTSMSYSGLGASSAAQGQLERAQSLSDHPSYTHERPMTRPSRSFTNPNMGTSGSYGLGFPYTQQPQYQQPLEQTQPQSLGMGPHSTLDMNQYRRTNNNDFVGTPITYNQYPATNFATSPMPQYTPYDAGFISQPYSNPYQSQSTDSQTSREDFSSQAQQQQQQQPMQQQSYAPLPDPSNHFGPLMGASGGQDDENSEVGVSVGPY